MRDGCQCNSCYCSAESQGFKGLLSKLCPKSNSQVGLLIEGMRSHRLTWGTSTPAGLAWWLGSKVGVAFKPAPLFAELDGEEKSGLSLAASALSCFPFTVEHAAAPVWGWRGWRGWSGAEAALIFSKQWLLVYVTPCLATRTPWLGLKPGWNSTVARFSGRKPSL